MRLGKKDETRICVGETEVGCNGGKARFCLECAVRLGLVW